MHTGYCHLSIAVLSLTFAAAVPAQLVARRDTALHTTSRELFAIPNSNVWRTFDSPNGKYFIVDGGPDGNYAWLVRPDGSRIATIARAQGAAVTRRVDRVAFLRPVESPKSDGREQWPQFYVWTVPIDTASGRLVGEPRRVGIHPSGDPAFSPDGRTLSYIRTDADGSLIAAIPANGGDERIVIRRPGRIRSQGWSPDGKWIYYEHLQPDAPSRIERVPVIGGKPDSVTSPSGEFLGFSRDGRYFSVVARARESISLFRSNGEALGVVRVDGVRPTWSAMSPSRLIVSRADARHVLRSLSLDNGVVRDLPVATGKDRAPRFTPDGKKLLFTGIVQGRAQLFLADADGGNRRALPTKAEPTNGPPGLPIISPDGRLAVFASDNARKLNVLDLTTGAERALPIPLFGRFAWRSDSRAIVYVSPATNHRTIRQVSLDGRDTLLRDLGPFPPRRRVYFLNDTLVASLDSTGMRAWSLRSEATRTLVEGPMYDGYVWGDVTMSRDGKWMGLASYDPDADATQPIMASLDGAQIRKLGAPFSNGSGVIDWLPNGRGVVLWGYEHKDGDGRIYLASLDGTPRRDLAPSEKPGVIEEQTAALRPDGRQLVYGVDVSLTLRVVGMDLTTLAGR